MSQSTRYRGKRREREKDSGNSEKEAGQEACEKRSVLKTIIKLLIGGPIILYTVLVIVMYTSPLAREQMIYLNVVKSPFLNLSNPALYGAENATNFFIEGPAGKLGAWYIPAIQNQQHKADIADGRPIILYLHGNAFTRAYHHRLEIYKMLTSLSYHVVAIDYRGFGDSEGYPSEQGLIDDGLAAWHWVKARSGSSLVLIWGHSLGSAVAAGVAENLCKKRSPPSGVILEAAFNTVYDAAGEHSIAKPFKFLPYFKEVVLDEVKELFRTDKRITHVDCPILILHDRDDNVVLFKFGKKLYEHARATRSPSAAPVRLVEFNGKHGHDKLWSSKLLPGVIREFVQEKK